MYTMKKINFIKLFVFFCEIWYSISWVYIMLGDLDMKNKEYKRVVIKIGSSSLTHEKTGSINFAKMERLV